MSRQTWNGSRDRCASTRDSQGRSSAGDRRLLHGRRRLRAASERATVNGTGRSSRAAGAARARRRPGSGRSRHRGRRPRRNRGRTPRWHRRECLLLEPDVQVVRFQGPPGLTVEVLAPTPSPVPAGDGGGIITVGLKRGVGYRLKIGGIAERPGRELYPVVELVGHLHRPEGVDAGKYPIRVVFNQDDLDDAVTKARLVTKIIYLEDPDQAIPFHLPKDQVPVLTLSPTEPPLRVAQALGRPVAIVRMGVRKPTIEEIQAGPAGDRRPRLGRQHRLRPVPVPELLRRRNAACRAARSARPPRGPSNRLFRVTNTSATAAIAAPPRRQGAPAASAASILATRSSASTSDSRARIEPRVLPTNVVCIYAPRFAEVRMSTGPNQNDRHPACQHRQTSQQVLTIERQRLGEETGPEPGCPARTRTVAGHGLEGAKLPRRDIEQSRTERDAAAM